jgi:hypothetical protein
MIIAPGNSDLWSDSFPDHLIPDILQLVLNSWASFTHPEPDELEVPTTRRFTHALRQAKNLCQLPFRIEREPSEDDPITGNELGRLDIKFCPALSAREEIYFCFECKRLHVVENGTRRALSSQYVKEGMMRFVEGKYSACVDHGGMIGYVLDGKTEKAIQNVKKNIDNNRSDLKIKQAASLNTSSLLPDSSNVQESVHSLHRVFRIHHLFLGCQRKPKNSDTTSLKKKRKPSKQGKRKDG